MAEPEGEGDTEDILRLHEPERFSPGRQQLNTDFHLPNIWKLNKNIHHKDLFVELKRCVELSETDEKISIELVKFGVTELMKAVICGYYNKVQELLNEPDCVKTINYLTEYGESALYFAAYIGSTAILLLLIDHGALVTRDIISLESELLGAVRSDHAAIVEILLSCGSNVDVMCDDWTALHIACFNKTAYMIKILIESGADVNRVGEWTFTPVNMLFIEYAKRERYIQPCYDEWLLNRCLSTLVKSSDIDLNYSSKCALGNPPVLQRAIVMLSPAICKLLINNGASTDCLLDYRQRAIHDELVMFSILHTHKLGFGLSDRIQRYQDCLELLLHHGIEPQKYMWLDTMRLLLRQLKNVPLTKRKPEMEPVFKMLIDYSLKPVTLKALCRRVIRRSAGHIASKKINAIDGLAPKLKSFLLLDDIGTDRLYSS